MRAMGLFLGTTVLVAWFGAAPVPAGAQAAELAEVRTAMDEARYPEARSLLEAWWDERDGTADRRSRQEALWLRARLTPDPQMAELDYRRLVIEYPGGPFSDGALLRLAQGAEFRGEPATARQYLEILVRDYPGSEYRVEARDRLARLPAGETLPGDHPEPVPPVPQDPPPRTVTDTVAADTVAGDTVAADPLPPDPGPPPEREEETLSGSFTVQLGAFSTAERARALADQARDAGIPVRVVQVEGSALHRVRTGGYEDRAAAEAAVERVRALGFEALVSTDREAERSP